MRQQLFCVLNLKSCVTELTSTPTFAFIVVYGLLAAFINISLAENENILSRVGVGFNSHCDFYYAVIACKNHVFIEISISK